MLYCYVVQNEFYECILKYPSLLEVFLNTNKKQKQEIFYKINKKEIQKKGEVFFQTTIYYNDDIMWIEDECLHTTYQIEVFEDRICIDCETNPFYNFIQRIYPKCIFIQEN